MNNDIAQKVIETLTNNIDTLWVIDCAILVFIMQAGFMCMETGLNLITILTSADNIPISQKQQKNWFFFVSAVPLRYIYKIIRKSPNFLISSMI